MKPLRLTALAAVLLLGACSSPTDTVRLDGGASFDGGGMIGSGNATGSSGGTSTTSDTGGTTTSTDSTTQRGPGMMGSGN
jgi:hypothetical protein